MDLSRTVSNINDDFGRKSQIFAIIMYFTTLLGAFLKFLMTIGLTRNSAIADKPARRVYKSVKVSKHSTIAYVRYSFILCNCNFKSLKRAVFTIFDYKKCRDLEIRVRSHSMSLKVVPFYRFGAVSY